MVCTLLNRYILERILREDSLEPRLLAFDIGSRSADSARYVSYLMRKEI